MTLAPDDPRHGTMNGYTNLGCRCERCKKAIAAYMREYQHRTGRTRPRAEYLAELRANPPPHGTVSRYTNRWGCRCSLCREASRLAQAAYRAKMAARG